MNEFENVQWFRFYWRSREYHEWGKLNSLSTSIEINPNELDFNWTAITCYKLNFENYEYDESISQSTSTEMFMRETNSWESNAMLQEYSTHE